MIVITPPAGGGGAGSDTTAIHVDIVDAKGDVIAATAADAVSRLAVGADATVLTADSSTGTGLKWSAAPGGGIPATIVDVKGDLIVATAADTVARQAVGSNGTLLSADSAQAGGVAWVAQSTLVVAEGQVTNLTTDLAALTAAGKVVAKRTVTADATLVLADAGLCIEANHATNAIVITIPPNASVAYPVGTVIEFTRYGAGTMTITPGAAVTIPNRIEAAGTTSRTLTNRMSVASVRQRATDEWILGGDIS